MLFKNISFKISDLDTIKGIVKIAVSGLENVDSDGDIIKRGAWKKTILENIKRIRHLKDHDYTKNLGYPIELFETDKHLIAISKINVEKQIARDVISDYIFFAEGDRTIEHSVGFQPIPGKFEKNNDTGGYVYRELKLSEYSTLSFLGANENTPLIDIKEMTKQNYTDERLEQLEKRIKELEILVKPNPKPISITSEIENSLDIDKIKNFLKF